MPDPGIIRPDPDQIDIFEAICETRPIRRMRRFRDPAGTEHDELPNGKLRRRLRSGDPSPHPAPEDRDVVEAMHGPLTEMTTAEINRRLEHTTRGRHP